MKDNNVKIVLSTDNNYYTYLYVCLKSLICNSSKNNMYDIFILHNGITIENQEQLKALQLDNVLIQFVDMGKYLHQIDGFYTYSYFSGAVYYRLFIPTVFKDFEKILYFDADMCILEDVAKLYQINLKNNLIGAVMDVGMLIDCKKNKKLSLYVSNDLGLKNVEDYMQSGVILFNIKALNKFGFVKRCIKKSAEIKKPLWVDQCIINSVCNGKIAYFDWKWNVLWGLPFYYDGKYKGDLDYQKYLKSRQNMKIIHYAGTYRPWKYPFKNGAEIFWKYAKMTSVFNDILKINFDKDKINLSNFHYMKMILKLYCYKTMKRITGGEFRQKMKNKINKIKESFLYLNYFRAL